MSNNDTRIEILNEKEKIAANTDQTIDVLVRVIPPAIDMAEFKRPKLNFGISLDRSGSMSGEKMVRAREAAKYCVEQLLPRDTFSAVIFDDQVDVLFTNQRAEHKELLKRGIDRIEARNSTALHQGWVQSGIQVAEGLDRDAINRVLLITDGQANVGETRVDHIVAQARELADKGISTSTIGIGRDFNEDLLVPMAEAGQGNAWFVEETSDMVRIFETELKGLIDQIGHTATLGIRTSPGVKVVDVLNDLEKDASNRYVLPNLRAGSPLDIVVRLKVPKFPAGSSIGGAAAFELTYTDQATQKAVSVTAELNLEYDTGESVAALPRNAEVLEAVTLLMNARGRKEAMEHMDHGRYDQAGGTLDSILDAAAFAFAYSPSPALAKEKEDLSQLRAMMKDRSQDLTSRKRMSYQRDERRKSR